MSGLGDHLKYLVDHGVTLCMDERMQLQLAITELCDKIKFEEMCFWGKVNGKLKTNLYRTNFQYNNFYNAFFS